MKKASHSKGDHSRSKGQEPPPKNAMNQYFLKPAKQMALGVRILSYRADAICSVANRMSEILHSVWLEFTCKSVRKEQKGLTTALRFGPSFAFLS